MNNLSSLIIVLILVFASTSIRIPLVQGQYKCMLVYAVGYDETIKIDIDFPFINGWNQHDSYYLTLRNTQTQQLEENHIEFGHFRRQMFVDKSVIYQLCFEISSPRQIQQEVLIQYSADTHHMIDKNSMKIPDNLLKLDKMQQIYNNSFALSEIAGKYIDLQSDLYGKNYQAFKETDNIEQKIILVSVLEILLIVMIAGFQFVAIKKQCEQSNSSFMQF